MNMNSIMLTKIWKDKNHEHHAYEKKKKKKKNAGYVNVGAFQQ